MVKLVITIIAHSPIPLKVWFKSTLNRVQKHSRKRHLILQLPEHNLSVFPSCDDVATLFVHPHTCHGTCEERHGVRGELPSWHHVVLSYEAIFAWTHVLRTRNLGRLGNHVDVMLQPKQLGIRCVTVQILHLQQVRNQMRGTSGELVWVLISVSIRWVEEGRHSPHLNVQCWNNHTQQWQWEEDGGGLSTVTCNHRYNNSLSSKCSKGKHGNVRKLRSRQAEGHRHAQEHILGQ